MKYTTLRELIVKTHRDSLLQVKALLMKMKKRGLVFYQEDIVTLSPDTEFEIYFSFFKGIIEFENAFPVPLDMYYRYRAYQLDNEFLLPFYQSYYETTSTPAHWKESSFQVYQGWEFVWFYRKDERL
ncbi:hypothetical protein [Brevibacillus nitrificans]|uniref:hypothetical protein n=1 Tax=Brevibacillus nitrificans TaxID=651560 RepID=UPI00285D1EAD|nr:hypothetical protein [Brevibacillus nitrificans]MDR7319678.1 CRISPR/Cas system CMR subunit Cmr6 (Cas7 group RAMP superfamily) [Brevibacillus nitrificans]